MSDFTEEQILMAEKVLEKLKENDNDLLVFFLINIYFKNILRKMISLI